MKSSVLICVIVLFGPRICSGQTITVRTFGPNPPPVILSPGVEPTVIPIKPYGLNLKPADPNPRPRPPLRPELMSLSMPSDGPSVLENPYYQDDLQGPRGVSLWQVPHVSYFAVKCLFWRIVDIGARQEAVDRSEVVSELNAQLAAFADFIDRQRELLLKRELYELKLINSGKALNRSLEMAIGRPLRGSEQADVQGLKDKFTEEQSSRVQAEALDELEQSYLKLKSTVDDLAQTYRSTGSDEILAELQRVLAAVRKINQRLGIE